MILTLIGLFLVLTATAWWYGFYIRNDLSIPTANISKYKKVLIIFPHADDEVFSASGLIASLKDQNSHTTLAILTKGERGNHDAHLDLALKDVRSKEAQKVSEILGVHELIQEDFGDGNLKHNKDELKKYISKLISDQKPDLIVTYDLSGLYGHDDHITLSEVVTDIVKTQEVDSELWYVTFPKRTIAMLKLPEHMATDLNFKLRRVEPTFKVSNLPYLYRKIKAIYTYKSQLESFKSGVPVKQVPLWFYHSMSFYEYFHKVSFK